MSNILLTGVTGDIGFNYLQYLIDKIDINDKISILSRKALKDKSINQKIYKSGDIYNLNDINKLIDKSDVIIHIAGMLQLNSYSVEYKAKMFAFNSIFTALISNICMIKKKEKFFYMSSELVYKLDEKQIYTEWINKAYNFISNLIDDIGIISRNDVFQSINRAAKEFIEDNPIEDDDFYALTKYIGELFVLRLEGGIVARLSNVYGPGYTNDRKIARIIKAKLQGKKIYEKNDYRSYIFKDDLHKAMDKCIFDCNYMGKIINFTSKKIAVSTIVEEVDKIAPMLYGKVILEEDFVPNKEIIYEKNIVKEANIKSIEELLDEPLQDLKRSLQETIIYYQSTEKYNMNLKSEFKKYVFENEEFIDFIHGGGSSGHLLLLKDKNSKSYFVRKIALRDGIEGNGIPKMKNEILFMKYLKENNTKLLSIYPKIFKTNISEEVVYYDMEYLNNGKNLIDTLMEKVNDEKFFVEYGKLLKNIVDCGYKVNNKYITKKEGDKLVDSMCFDRAEGRVKYLYYYYKGEYLSALMSDSFFLNDRKLINPLLIINEFRNNPRFREIFRVAQTCDCVHGDLTFLNMIFSDKSKSIKLIDPRGLVGELDPMYDFGKMKFSLSGFSQIIKSRYIFRTSNNRFYIDLSEENCLKENLRRINEKFLEFLDKNDSFKEIVVRDVFWKERIKLYEAIHYLADIPFRLHTDEKGPQNSIVCYLFGTMYLNDLYEELLNKYNEISKIKEFSL